MSNSRVIFDIKATPKSSGNRSVLARYIAESKLDHMREGSLPRRLFSDHADDLSYREAEQLITRGDGVAAKHEIKHMVLSLRPRDYELLGADDEERSLQMREIAREVMRSVGDASGASYLKWYAGIHLNKVHPHIHFGLSKNAIDIDSGRPFCLEHIPQQLLTRNRMNDDGDRAVTPGGISRLVAAELDCRQRERVRFLQFADHDHAITVKFTRELLAPDALRRRAPTRQERLVGRWLVAEFDDVDARKTILREDDKSGMTLPERKELDARQVWQKEALHRLRFEVARLDNEEQHHDGKGKTAAYLAPEELSRILHNERPTLVISAFAAAPSDALPDHAGERKWRGASDDISRRTDEHERHEQLVERQANPGSRLRQEQAPTSEQSSLIAHRDTEISDSTRTQKVCIEEKRDKARREPELSR